MGNAYGSRQPVGCQFNLSVMSDDFVDVILSALEKTETAEVMMETDDVSSWVHGPISDVFAVVELIYLNAAQTGRHVAMSGTFSAGCPGLKRRTIPKHRPVRQRRVEMWRNRPDANSRSIRWVLGTTWRLSNPASIQQRMKV
ncbi:YkoF family thiamine/hydroxymethylpyrimidine-binding protein [Salinicoccus siamensis]|uniref:YkoF family thiamine/hydroxymethylpyrimidine-binding protein n=1 Tax=Salinicoccus siamensis TaxID=381830 RepID=UPI003613FF9D